jgi:hypothetical protein
MKRHGIDGVLGFCLFRGRQTKSFGTKKSPLQLQKGDNHIYE